MRRHISAICILSLFFEIAGAPSAWARKPSKNAVSAGAEKGPVFVIGSAALGGALGAGLSALIETRTVNFLSETSDTDNEYRLARRPRFDVDQVLTFVYVIEFRNGSGFAISRVFPSRTQLTFMSPITLMAVRHRSRNQSTGSSSAM
jgi:hypothetical protein